MPFPLLTTCPTTVLVAFGSYTFALFPFAITLPLIVTSPFRKASLPKRIIVPVLSSARVTLISEALGIESSIETIKLPLTVLPSLSVVVTLKGISHFKS